MNTLNDYLIKEAKAAALLETKGGIEKCAVQLRHPVKRKLDYKGIARGILVHEPWPDGLEVYYDMDIDEFAAVAIGQDGTSTVILADVERIFPKRFSIVVKPKIHWSTLRIAKYRPLQRLKERVIIALQLSEDLRLFALSADAVTLTGNSYTATGEITKEVLSFAFRSVENSRLFVAAVVTNPPGISGIRRWERDQLDEAARIEIRDTGYIGRLWGAKFFVTDQLPIIPAEGGGTLSYNYVYTKDQYLGWMPMSADSVIVPADRPDDQLVGFVGWEFLAMVIHNVNGVARVVFNPEA